MQDYPYTVEPGTREQGLVERKKEQGGVEAVDRAISILGAFRRGEQPITLTMLCERTGLHKSTALRLAESLERSELLHRLPDKRYRLGPAVVRLARVFNSMISLPEIARIPCEALMQRTHLSVSLYVRQGESRVCVMRSDPPEILRDAVEVVDVRPLDQTATGLTFRRYQDASAESIVPEPIHTLGIYNPGTASLAFPIFGQNGRIAAVLTLSGAAESFGAQPVGVLVTELARTARQIEEAYGLLA
jgi:DNA-binding IclR family transcriptional regulator